MNEAVKTRTSKPFKDIIRYRPLPANVGIANARNASAELARGQYLVIVKRLTPMR